MIDSAISFFYTMINQLGYHHPFHPTQVHFPVGLILGSFILGIAGKLRHHPTLGKAALYCQALALIWILPTVISGFMDWRHYYGGAFLVPFTMKFLLATFLTIFLAIGVFIGFRRGSESIGVLVTYTLSLISVVGLGFFGGELVYGDKSQLTAQEGNQVEEFWPGRELYANNCNGCHANGGNVVNPALPIKGSAKTDDFNTFLAWIRNPNPPMPTYPDSVLSDQQARDLFQYIINELNRS